MKYLALSSSRDMSFVDDSLALINNHQSMVLHRKHKSAQNKGNLSSKLKKNEY